MAFGAIELLVILLVVGGGILGLIVLAVNSGEGGRILAVVAGIVAVLVIMMIGGVLVMRNTARSQAMVAMVENEAAMMEAEAAARLAANSDLQENAVVIAMTYKDVSVADAEAMTKSFADSFTQHMAVIEGNRTSSSNATFNGDLSTGEVTATLYPKSSTTAVDLDRAVRSLTSAVNTELSDKQGFTISVDSRFNSSQ